MKEAAVRFGHLIPLLLFPAAAAAETVVPDTSIHGLKSVCVIVTADDVVAALHAELERQVVNKLGTRVMAVVSLDCPKVPFESNLSVLVRAVESGSGRLVALQVDFELSQPVSLAAEPMLEMRAITWRQSRLGLVRKEALESVTRKFVGQLSSIMTKSVVGEPKKPSG